MCDLVNQLLAVKAISDKDMEKLKRDKYVFYDPLVLMDLRHKQVRKIYKKPTKCSHAKTSDIESSRILREEEQRKRMKMRETSIINRKLDEFKREIERSKKRFERHAKILDTGISSELKKRKPAVKVPLPVNDGNTAETVHQKTMQSFKHSAVQISVEKNDSCVQDCATQKLEVHDSSCPEKTEVLNTLQCIQTNNCQTDYQEKESFSEPSNCLRKLPLILRCPSVNVEIKDIIDNIPNAVDLISSPKSASTSVNCSTIIDTVHDEVRSSKCELSMSKVTDVKYICKSDDDILGRKQSVVIQQENKLHNFSPEVSTHQEVKTSVENEHVFNIQHDVKTNMYDTIDFMKDTDVVNATEIQVSESEAYSKKYRSPETQEGEQYSQLEWCVETAQKNSSKKGLAGVFVSTLVRQNTQKNHRKKSVKGNQKEDTSLSIDGKPGKNRDCSQAEILQKYWQLWKDHTFSEKQKTKVNRLLSVLEEFQKNDQQEQHMQQRTGCHSAGPALENQHIQNSREDLSNLPASTKRKNGRKPIRCQSMPTTSNGKSFQVKKRRGRERNTSQQDMIDDIEHKVRELSAERQKREAALSQEKEEMHIKPYGKVPFWVLQPQRLIATESVRRDQERKEAIKLRLETKRLQQEQQAAAEKMRLEAEAERVRALRELVWTQYKRKVSRRLLLDPLRVLVAESRQKEAQASVFASQLLLRKYFKAWRKTTFEKMNVLAAIVHRVRLRRAFQAFLEIKANTKRQNQVAEDFYNVWILQRRAFIKWRSFLEEQLAQEATVIQLALQHYNRTLLCHYFRQWYKVRNEKKRRERLEVWRIRVREVLPDFMPPEID